MSTDHPRHYLMQKAIREWVFENPEPIVQNDEQAEVTDEPETVLEE